LTDKEKHMARKTLDGLKVLYRPQPVGWLSAILSAAVLLAGAWQLGGWQAREVERGALQALHNQASARGSHFYAQLYGHLQALEALPLQNCTAAGLAQLRALRRHLLYVREIGYLPASGPACGSGRLPTLSELQQYQHWQFGALDLWWAPGELANPQLPSLVMGRNGYLLASSLQYLRDQMSMPGGIDALLIGPKGEQVLDFIGGSTRPTDEQRRAMAMPQQLLVEPQRVYFSGSSDTYGIRLLISDDPARLQQLFWRYRALWAAVALLLAGLLGRLAALQLRRDQSLEHALEIALRRGELEVDYQPLIDLHSRRCLGAEALVRWRRADGQRVRPDLFIPQAEDSGQICAITRRVIELVLSEQAELLKQYPDLYISVNLAAADILDGAFVAHAQRLLAEHGVPAQQLLYEVTERGLVDVQLASSLLQEQRDSGHRIAIDDFGTGYSSLSYLQQLPVDVLKIDKSFVDTLGSEAASSPVAPHIIQMARALGLKVIAEGIEHEQQAQLLLELGAHVGQGWLFAKAMDAASFRAFVAEHA
jgi:sensor c-di-GMP phosphodiesterase-like protein